MKSFSAFLIAVMLLSPAMVYAADDFVNAQDHATLASLYEQRAADEDALINQHERMKRDSDFYRKNSSATAQGQMDQHCSAIIEKAKALQAELTKTAEWHKNQG